MLTPPFIIAVLAILVALVALVKARSAGKRLERMSESYWELRYESGQLRSRVTRLEVQTGLREAEPSAEAPQAPSKTTFVPLSSLKK